MVEKWWIEIIFFVLIALIAITSEWRVYRLRKKLKVAEEAKISLDNMVKNAMDLLFTLSLIELFSAFKLVAHEKNVKDVDLKTFLGHVRPENDTVCDALTYYYQLSFKFYNMFNAVWAKGALDALNKNPRAAIDTLLVFALNTNDFAALDFQDSEAARLFLVNTYNAGYDSVK
jgi:hypothetical protein